MYGKYYGVFGKYENQDTFIFFEHDDLVFKSMAFNVNSEKFNIQEKPSNPSREAIENITASLKNRIKEIQGYEIKDVINELLQNNTNLVITERNITSIFIKWLDNIEFTRPLKDEDILINLFLTDILNGTTYTREVIKEKQDLLGKEEKCNTNFEIFEGKTNGQISFTETNENGSKTYLIKNREKYDKFWNIYKRPPSHNEFIKMYDTNRHLFFSDSYRKKVGGQYTPKILIDLQNKILKENNINSDNYIIFDCCCGTANLQENFENKDNIYLSTLDLGDLLVAQSKGFKNVVQFDFLKDNTMPKWNYQGTLQFINEIAKIEKKEVLVIINPPYEEERFIKFTEKIVKNIENCKFFLYSHYKLFSRKVFFNRLKKLKPTILSNNLVSAELFGLSNWGVSMTLFDFKKDNKRELNDKVEVIRFEPKEVVKNGRKIKIMEKLNKISFFPEKELYENYFKENLKNFKTSLINTSKEIKIGHYSIMRSGMVFDNFYNRGDLLTNKNLEEVLVCNGVLYNTHPEYWEDEVIKVPSKELSGEFKINCIISSLFYKGNNTINDIEYKNYFIPFTEKEIGIYANTFNTYIENGEKLFDFRQWLSPYKHSMSSEAKDLYKTSLEIYKFYFEYFGKNADYNVGFRQLKDNLIQGTINIKKLNLTENTMTGRAARIGEYAKWTPSILDKKYSTNIFSLYDNAIKKLFNKIQDQMIEHGILEQRMANLR